MHEKVSADYTDMIHAETAKQAQAKRRAFLRKWRLRCPAVAASLEEAGDLAQTTLRYRWLFAFLRLPPSQWKSARTTNAIERLQEKFKRRIKTQTVLPSAETAAMLFWALLASGPAKREAFARDHHAQGGRVADLGRDARHCCPR